MALQDIIDTAVNIEVNRSKLVAQNVSRSGRISVAQRNWANPFRFTVTPKPIWTNAEYRAIFEPIFNADKFEYNSMRLNQYNDSTGVATLGNSWMTAYQGGGDTNGNNSLDAYLATTATGSTRIILGYNSGTADAGTYIVKKGDWIRPSTTTYPYIAESDVIIPTAFSAKTGTIQTAGTTITTSNSFITYTATTTRTAITGIASTTGLSVGQIVTENGANTGSFGGVTYISSIDSATQVSIVNTSAFTAGAITFDGTGPTSSPSMAVPIHRGYLDTISSPTQVRVGPRAAWFRVVVTQLPQMRFLPGQYVEFTGDFELIEVIL